MRNSDSVSEQKVLVWALFVLLAQDLVCHLLYLQAFRYSSCVKTQNLSQKPTDSSLSSFVNCFQHLYMQRKNQV